jgi:hypothetical protein
MWYLERLLIWHTGVKELLKTMVRQASEYNKNTVMS